MKAKKTSKKSLYDPDYPPAPDWLALDEAERIDQIRKYHRHAGVRLPNPRLHATFHAVVETQIALGDELPVRAILERLMAEGLDRHDAIHAIGFVLSRHIYHIFQGEGQGQGPEDMNLAYFAELEKLTAEGWRQS